MFQPARATKNNQTKHRNRTRKNIMFLHIFLHISMEMLVISGVCARFCFAFALCSLDGSLVYILVLEMIQSWKGEKFWIYNFSFGFQWVFSPKIIHQVLRQYLAKFDWNLHWNAKENYRICWRFKFLSRSFTKFVENSWPFPHQILVLRNLSTCKSETLSRFHPNMTCGRMQWICQEVRLGALTNRLVWSWGLRSIQ